MIFEYCQKAIEKAEYKKLDDGTWYAEVLPKRSFARTCFCSKTAMWCCDSWLRMSAPISMMSSTPSCEHWQAGTDKSPDAP
jgi:hypothetical protein